MEDLDVNRGRETGADHDCSHDALNIPHVIPGLTGLGAGCLKRSIRYADNSFGRGQRTQGAVVERFPGTKFANLRACLTDPLFF
jgi:hypothetical protein